MLASPRAVGMGESRDIGPVLITGCSSGLGYASALAFREAGYLTIATARNVAMLAPLAEHGCEMLTLDVSIESSRRAAIGEVERRHGAVGVLVNNAGYGQYGPLEEMSPELVQRCFDTNLFGLLRMAQLVLPGMRRAGRGRIVARRRTAPGGQAVRHRGRQRAARPVYVGLPRQGDRQHSRY